MKKLSLLTFVLAGFLVFSSCDKEEMGPVMNSDPGSPAITAPESGQSFTLSEDETDQNLVTFEWNNPDYGFSAAPDVTIEMVETGNDFSDPIEFANTQGTSYSITVGEMNANLLGLGFTPLQESTLDFRVKTTLTDTSYTSDTITLGFTPFSTCEYCPEIYVPGSYQGASNEGNDWDPGTAPALTTVDLTDNYEGYVYMANGGNQFKFTPERNWSSDWGDSGGDGTLEPGSDNIEIADPGYYKINVNINRLEYTVTQTQWGLIGSATANEWESDQNMTYDSANQVWTITTDLTSGEVKFRANDAWNIEYGDNGADGILEAGGENIAIDSDGNYTIELDLSGDPYTYSITQN
ncbi:SusE domain-containing protein [Fodinibius sp. SL11]|uniref:SusE domain-containing protein n=1 Tax=Fodinibius sp. SL11 TaxID=3425690 RepID=UPI003F884BEC